MVRGATVQEQDNRIGLRHVTPEMQVRQTGHAKEISRLPCDLAEQFGRKVGVDRVGPARPRCGGSSGTNDSQWDLAGPDTATRTSHCRKGSQLHWTA